MVFEKFESKDGFERAEIMKITGLSPSAAGVLINKLLDAKLIIPVKGKEKGTEQG